MSVVALLALWYEIIIIQSIPGWTPAKMASSCIDNRKSRSQKTTCDFGMRRCQSISVN